MSDSDIEDSTKVHELVRNGEDRSSGSNKDAFVDLYIDAIRDYIKANKIEGLDLSNEMKIRIGRIYSDVLSLALELYSVKDGVINIPFKSTDDDFFYGLDRDNAIGFVKGFRGTLERLFAASHLRFSGKQEKIVGIEAKPLAELPIDLAEDIAYAVLSDGIEILSEMHDAGYFPDPIEAGSNTPAIYFDRVVVISVIERAKQQGTEHRSASDASKPQTTCQLIHESPQVAVTNLREALLREKEQAAIDSEHPSVEKPTFGVVDDSGEIREHTPRLGKLGSRFKGKIPGSTTDDGIVIPFQPRYR
ncbi:MAG: hypothetical protein U0R17_07075 [Acidimicrobiia bacterium]